MRRSADVKDLPSTARIVVVGAGVVGCSVAYHLTKLGISDIVVLESGQIASGTSWHAAGLIMQLRLSHSLTALAKYNVELYAGLEAETGQATGFKQNGTLGVARTEARMHEIARLAGIAKSFGIEAHLLTPAQAGELYPEMHRGHVCGAIYIPHDGQLNAVDTTMALAAGAKQGGAQIFEESAVVSMSRLPKGDYRLDTTTGGAIECETLVLCAGLWTRDLAAQLGIRVPLFPCEHMYVVTQAMDWITPDLPVLRDTDGYVYIKEEAGKLLIGSFEPEGKPLPMEHLPSDSRFIELQEDWDHFALPFSKAIEILPSLEHAGIVKFMNGPESFTPDSLLVLGEAPGTPRCFIAAGLNSEGFEVGAGAGRALAEWIVAGEATMDLSDVDIARFHPFQVNRRYLHDRAAESLGDIYQMHWPHKQREASRPVRTSPMHDRLAAMNACFGETLGWERALWFAPHGMEARNEYAWRRPNWFEHVGEEHEAVRENVGIFDVSSFGKHLLQGRDACKALQRLCANDMDVPIGKLVYTHMLNRRGGIETDLTVNRLADDRFLLVSSAAFQPRDKAWIESHLQASENVVLTDVTSAYAALSVQGPNSRTLLARLTDTDLSDEAFPFASSREIELGYARVIASRLTFVGELGWELFIPTEFARGVFDAVVEEGSELGLRQVGYHAMEHLRCERGYREFGLDLTPDDTPFEAGLGFVVKMDKPGGFLGREALETRQGQTRTKRLVLFKLEDPEPELYRDELIVLDERIVGYLSSGAYGYTLGASVGMGYVHHPDGVTRELVENGSFQIEVAGSRYPAEASLRPFYDPDGERVRM
jgi:4-methylaminobutanoate oxidase (formaldehyde-forming)